MTFGPLQILKCLADAPDNGGADLIGLDVENLEGIQLGKIDTLYETGANDIFVVKGDKERALPFIQGQTIKSIDFDAGKMIVDWDAEF